MGVGFVGFFCVVVVVFFGVIKIVQVDIVQLKLDFVKFFVVIYIYFFQCVFVEENVKNFIVFVNFGKGVDVVIDVFGVEFSIQIFFYVVCMGGIYVQGGMGKLDINFFIMVFCLKEVMVCGLFCYGSGDYKFVIEFVVVGKVDVKKFVNGVVVFKDVELVFKKVKEGEVIKIFIVGFNEKVEIEFDIFVDFVKFEVVKGNIGCC